VQDISYDFCCGCFVDGCFFDFCFMSLVLKAYGARAHHQCLLPRNKQSAQTHSFFGLVRVLFRKRLLRRCFFVLLVSDREDIGCEGLQVLDCMESGKIPEMFRFNRFLKKNASNMEYDPNFGREASCTTGASLAKWLMRSPCKRKVVSSTLTGGIEESLWRPVFFCAAVACLQRKHALCQGSSRPKDYVLTRQWP
jgi:hypothetical protein